MRFGEDNDAKNRIRSTEFDLPIVYLSRCIWFQSSLLTAVVPTLHAVNCDAMNFCGDSSTMSTRWSTLGRLSASSLLPVLSRPSCVCCSHYDGCRLYAVPSKLIDTVLIASTNSSSRRGVDEISSVFSTSCPHSGQPCHVTAE